MALPDFMTIVQATASPSRPARKKLQKKRPRPTAPNTKAGSCKWFFRKGCSQFPDIYFTQLSLESQESAVIHKYGATTKIKQLFDFRRHKTQTMSKIWTSAPPTNKPADHTPANTTTSSHTGSETPSQIFSLPPDSTASASMTPMARPRNNPFRRLLSIFAHSKRDSAMSLGESIVTPQEQIDVEEDTYSDEGEPDTEDEHDRRNFKAIRGIPREVIEAFVLKLFHPENSSDLHTCHVTQRKEGSFHHVVFLQIELDGAPQQEFVLKIPAHGTAEHWEEFDIYMLRNEAILMQHIRHYTECPVPKVITFDEYMDNPIGAPYILMEMMSGVSALDLWVGQPHKSLKIGEEYLDADTPTQEIEQKRMTFLRSLAHAMSHLQNLQFAEIGLPVFDKAEDGEPGYYGAMWRWHSKNTMYALTPSGPFETSEEFFLDGLNEALDPREVSHLDPNSPGVLIVKGIRKVLDIVFSSTPFATHQIASSADAGKVNNTKENTPVKESFVLRHDDLDLQNILIDDAGNVTCIIDWDGCMSVPRCIGYTSLPTFLRRDWLPDHTIDRAPHTTWSLDNYRDIYAKAMEDSCQPPISLASRDQIDAKFTRKSAIYQALLAAVYEDEDIQDVVGKLLVEIPELRRVNLDSFYVRLGKGWPAAEKVLEAKIPELLRPE
ncbi:Nn.00g072130.m01.CDS01 [Neocucurbitaria sp. VM-36]